MQAQVDSKFLLKLLICMTKAYGGVAYIQSKDVETIDEGSLAIVPDGEGLLRIVAGTNAGQMVFLNPKREPLATECPEPSQPEIPPTLERVLAELPSLNPLKHQKKMVDDAEAQRLEVKQKGQALLRQFDKMPPHESDHPTPVPPSMR